MFLCACGGGRRHSIYIYIYISATVTCTVGVLVVPAVDVMLVGFQFFFCNFISNTKNKQHETEGITSILGTPKSPKIDRYPSPPSEPRPWKISMKFNYAFKTLLISPIWPHNFRWKFTRCLRCECRSHFETDIFLWSIRLCQGCKKTL